MLLKAQRLDLDDQPIIEPSAEVYFVIKSMWKDTSYYVKKTLGNGITLDQEGWYHITIEPEDTEDMPYGKYVWDFTVVENGGEYREKPARGYLVVGNSSGWIVNQQED